jgi:hypothetical protein
MRLVSERSEAQIQTHEALIDLKHALRSLTANLMRVTRGAGSSAQLSEQMVACLDAMDTYGKATGNEVPSRDLDQMLDPEAAYVEHRPGLEDDAEAQARWVTDGTTECALADQSIRRASLQVIASMLVNQTPQQRKAEVDFAEAIRGREAARERRLAYRQAQLDPAPRARKKPK